MKKGLSQELLKLIACLTMLLDHIGALCAPARDLGFWELVVLEGTAYISAGMYYTLRGIGRLSFPIYCFLLAEGACHTRNPRKYASRLAVGMLLAEIPFDFAFYGGFTWEYQSVMVTLMLGYGALLVMNKCNRMLLKVAAVIPFALAADWLCTDYGGYGVVMIALFALTRELPGKQWIQVAGLALINGIMPSAMITVLGLRFSIQLLALGAMIPIAMYSGQKTTGSKAVQWGFYLFYPVHMALLWLLMEVFGLA